MSIRNLYSSQGPSYPEAPILGIIHYYKYGTYKLRRLLSLAGLGSGEGKQGPKSVLERGLCAVPSLSGHRRNAWVLENSVDANLPSLDNVAGVLTGVPTQLEKEEVDTKLEDGLLSEGQCVENQSHKDKEFTGGSENHELTIVGLGEVVDSLRQRGSLRIAVYRQQVGAEVAENVQKRKDGKGREGSKERSCEEPQQRHEEVLNVLVLRQGDRVEQSRDTGALAVGFEKDNAVGSNHRAVELLVPELGKAGALKKSNGPQSVEEESNKNKNMA